MNANKRKGTYKWSKQMLKLHSTFPAPLIHQPVQGCILEKGCNFTSAAFRCVNILLNIEYFFTSMV